MIEPGAGLVAERAPEIADRPIARGIAAEERHVDGVVRHVGVRDAFLREQQVVHMIVVDDHGAFAAEQLDAVGLAERRIARGQGVADAEIDHGAVGEGHDRPGDVMGAVAGLPEDAVLSARHHLDRPVALQEPAHQVDVIGEHVEHRRRVRVALEDGEGLRTRVVDARRAADDPAEAAVQHLLLGAQEAFLVAAAVADPQIALGRAQGIENLVGVAQRKADRLLHQDRLAELQAP